MFVCIDRVINQYEYIGRQKAIRLMKYVDEINMEHGGAGTRLFSTANSNLKKKCFEHDLKLLEAQVRHLGTDKNYVVLENLYNDRVGLGASYQEGSPSGSSHS